MRNNPCALILFIYAYFFCHVSSAQMVTATPQESISDDINLVEIKLIAPLDESRGWCVDLFAHLTNALPLGGFQGHNCFLYFGRGVTEDQGFDLARFKERGEFRLVYFDVCMTLYTPNSGSFVAAEGCSGEDIQKFQFSDSGQIQSVAAPQLCLTLGDLSVPGGGRLAPVGTRPPANNENIHLIRKLSFENCEDANAALQQWSLRNEYEVEEATQRSRFLKSEEIQ